MIVEAAALEVVVDRELHADRAHEVVALLAGVLAGGLGEFSDEGVLDLVETRVIDGAQHHGVLVGNDAATLDIDRAVVVHLADETTAEFDRADRPFGTTKEHAVDHTLQTVLQ